MARDFEEFELADNIRDSKHAGAAIQISKEMADDESRLKWESENTSLMEQLLQSKVEHCEQFKACLLEKQHTLFALATTNKLWGTGMSVYATQRTSPNYWTGQNLLGGMLTDLAQQLTYAEGERQQTAASATAFHEAINAQHAS